MRAELLLDSRAQLGEGPIWHPKEQALYWVDIEGCQVHRYCPETHTDKSVRLPERVGAVVPRRNGQLVVALQNSIAALDFESGELVETLCPFEADQPGVRANDGKCDPQGRFWIGSMDLKCRQGAGAFYCLDTDGKLDLKLDDVSISNGLAWTADHQTLFYIDSPTGKVDAFDFDVDRGDISNRRTAFEIPEGAGSPDGMAIDVNGNLWIAMFFGSAVLCFDPATGEVLERVELDVPFVTACAFGGEKLDTLFITTATSEDAPTSGGLFVAKPNVCGSPTFSFNG